MNEATDSRRPENDANDPLEGRAQLDVFEKLQADGDLSSDALERAHGLIEDSAWVATWFSRALLLFGTSLAVAGVVFFFAFNWDDLPALAKLGLVQVGFAAALAGATLKELESTTSRILLLVAGVLIGVFFAVFGQIYQTGADAWELFAIWGVLLTPLAVLARTQGGWVLWALVCSVAGGAWIDQMLIVSDSVEEMALHGWMLGIIGIALIVTEYLRRKEHGLVESFPWSRGLLLSVGFGVSTIAVIANDSVSDVSILLDIPLWLAASFAAVRFYTKTHPDIVGPAVVSISVLVVTVRWVLEGLIEVFGDTFVSFLLISVITIGLTGALVWLLRNLHASLHSKTKEKA